MTRDEAMEVFTIRSTKFNNTQQIQWKMNLAVWTLLVLINFNEDEITLPWESVEWLTIVIKGILGGFLIRAHFEFCKKVQWSLECDKAVNDDIAQQLNQVPYYRMFWLILKRNLQKRKEAHG